MTGDQEQMIADIARATPPKRGTLIGLCSPAMQSGKSTVAEYLVDTHGFARVAFATPLKGMTKVFFESMGMSKPEIHERVYGALKEAQLPGLPDGITSRRVQQALGTEFGRDCIAPDLWARIARLQIEAMWAVGLPVVIDDMRFPNEADMIEELGGRCVRILRPGFVDHTGHASEGQLNNRRMTQLVNDSTVRVLLDQVDALLRA